MSKFQIAVIVLFLGCLIAGIIAFATFKGDKSNNSLPTVTIWGTFPADVFNKHIGKINNQAAKSISVNYSQKSPDSFSQEFVQALARGIGPDAILIPADMILPQMDKLSLIPYVNFSQRRYMDEYIPEAEMYLANDGIWAIPFTVDPLVMYWNKDTYSSAGFTSTPKSWGEFSKVTEKINVKDQNGNIRKSALAMGSFNNIVNAREVLGSLILQLGNPITYRDPDGVMYSYLEATNEKSPVSAVEFYSKFANPSDPQYSWNRGIIEDKTSFLSGNLATYFGFASEIRDIRSKNPNLNFDVSPLPQYLSGGKIAGYAKMYGFSIVKASPNANAAYQTVSVIAGTNALAELSKDMYLPSVMKSLFGVSNDPYLENFEKAALVARSWLDVNPGQSKMILSSMIDSITSGRKRAREAVEDASDEYQLVLDNATK